MDATLSLNNNIPVLKNLLNLKEAEELDMAIKYFSLIRMDELKFIKLPEKINLNFFKGIHKYIFGDIFDWAGEIDNKEKIEEGSQIIQDNLQKDWLRMHLQEKAENITEMIFDLTKLQPFEVGTYQAVMTFTNIFTNYYGLALDQAYIDSKAVAIENAIAIDTDICREGVVEIVKEAIAAELVKENVAENIEAAIKADGFNPTIDIVEYIKKLNGSLFKFHTVTEICDLYKYPDSLGDMEKKIVCNIGEGFAFQEKQYTCPSYKTKQPNQVPELEY